MSSSVLVVGSEAALLGGGGNRKLSYQIRVCPWIAAFGRGRVGLTVARRNVIFDASLQPGTGSGVGGKGRWTAIAVPPQTESAGGRGKIATVVSGVTDMVDASGMPPGLARVRASFYGHDAPS